MKLKSVLLHSLLAAGLVASARAQEIKLPGAAADAPKSDAAPATAPAALAAPAAAFTEAQMLETIGWFMGKNSQADTFEFTPDQIHVVARGFALALAGKESPSDLKQIGPQIQAYVTSKQTAYLGKLKEKGTQESAEFFTEIKKKPGIVVLPSGLAYEIIKQGDGPTPKATETVRANYTGTLVNGTVFDSSYQRNEPVEFPLNQVIPGWTEGLQKISKGGKIKLYVPPTLAYGDEGRPGIPPASTLIFDIEILDIKPTPAAPATPALPPAAAPVTK